MAELFYSVCILILALYGAVCLSHRLYVRLLFPKGNPAAYLLVPLRGEACEQSLRAALALARDVAGGRLRGVVAADLGLDETGRRIVQTMQQAGQPVICLPDRDIPADLKIKLQEILE